MAKRYGVSKSEFLDERTGGDGTSLAVKLAQGETHILQQSTDWLAENGVSMEALQQASQRLAVGGNKRDRMEVEDEECAHEPGSCDCDTSCVVS